MVKSLFYNVPARRKFLKSDSTEMSHIAEEFYRVALAHPDVEMSLTHNGVEMLNLPAANAMTRILGIVGKSYAKMLLPIGSETSVARIKGYVGTPECAKIKADQYFFVNGRFMKHPGFNRAVQKAYDQLLPQGKSPTFFIYIDVDPATIDINIHPTKTEIKFENEQSIWPIMQATVKEALGKFNVGPAIDFDIENRIEMPTYSKSNVVAPPQIHYTAGYNPFEEVKGKNSAPAQHTSGQTRTSTDWQKLYGEFESAARPAQKVPEQQSLNLGLAPDSQPAATGRFFQLKGRYILTSVKSGLMIIDQHRAHERIVFERMLKRSTDAASQRLLYPERLDLNLKDTDLFRQMMPELEKLGFEINDLGGNSSSVSVVPATFPEKELKDWVNSILMLTGEDYISMKESMTESMAASLASYMAIGYGRQLTQEEMADMNAQLFACKMPNFTPSGRPIVSIINTDDIDKLFK